MQCACTSGIIHCSRKVSLVKFLELTPLENPPIHAVTFTELCNQSECNVAKYMEKNAGVCYGKFLLAFVADRIFYHGTFSLTSTDIDVRLPCILTFTGMLSTFDFLRRFRRSLLKYLATITLQIKNLVGRGQISVLHTFSCGILLRTIPSVLYSAK